MSMHYVELDNITRKYMLMEFETEESGDNPYRSKSLSDEGLQVFPDLMREAIQSGTEVTPLQALNNPTYWHPFETYVRSGVTQQRRTNFRQAAERLSLTEFNTWYVRGLARRLLEEGIEQCQIYRGAQPKWQEGDCSRHEGLIVAVQVIYDGHRAKYWPAPGNPTAFSIPSGPGCHHVIRRI